jgi:hypothetical protein
MWRLACFINLNGLHNLSCSCLNRYCRCTHEAQVCSPVHSRVGRKSRRCVRQLGEYCGHRRTGRGRRCSLKAHGATAYPGPAAPVVAVLKLPNKSSSKGVHVPCEELLPVRHNVLTSVDTVSRVNGWEFAVCLEAFLVELAKVLEPQRFKTLQNGLEKVVQSDNNAGRHLLEDDRLMPKAFDIS